MIFFFENITNKLIWAIFQAMYKNDVEIRKKVQFYMDFGLIYLKNG